MRTDSDFILLFVYTVVMFHGPATFSQKCYFEFYFFKQDWLIRFRISCETKLQEAFQATNGGFQVKIYSSFRLQSQFVFHCTLETSVEREMQNKLSMCPRPGLCGFLMLTAYQIGGVSCIATFVCGSLPLLLLIFQLSLMLSRMTCVCPSLSSRPCCALTLPFSQHSCLLH